MSERFDFYAGAPVNFTPLSIAGGKATEDEILGASDEQMRLVDNTDAAYRALEQGYAERSKAIKEATGIELGNPLVPDDTATNEEAQRLGIQREIAAGLIVERQREAYGRSLEALAHEYPGHIGAIRPGTPVDRDAEALARAADENLATLMASNPSWSASAAMFMGSMLGSLRDPLTIGSLFIGGGPGAARTVGGRLVQVAAKEALINAGTEAVAQPANQAWREQAGLPHGFDMAAQNVLLAGALGGAFGGLAGGAHEIVRVLKPARAALPAEARGAIDMAEQLEGLDAQRPAGVAPERFDRRAAAADAEAQRVETGPIEPDDLDVNRIVNALAPSPESVAGAAVGRSEASLATLVAGVSAEASQRAPTPVLALLRRLGPFDPSSPVGQELRAAGITSPSLFKKGGGRALDNVPHDELPAEIRHAIADDGNGYASQQALIDAAALELEGRGGRSGTDDLGEERAFYERQGVDFDADPQTVRQHILEIDDIGRRYGGQSDETVAVPEGVSRRDHTAELVRQVLRAQPGLPAETVQKAVNLALFERMPIGEALDDVMSDAAGVPRPGREAAGEISPLRGMIDELGTEPQPPVERAAGDEAEDGIDLKAERAALEELGFTGDSLPIGDQLVSLDELEARLKETEWLESVVEACKA